MSATVSVNQATGSGPTNTEITNLRFSISDYPSPGSLNPMLIPTSGVTKSYWKTIFLNADTTPDVEIDNVKFYGPDSLSWTGAVIYVGTTDTYTQATGNEGVDGDDSAVATTDLLTYTSASPLSVSGSITNDSTGKISDYVVLQLEIDTTAEVGTTDSITLVFEYDEH